MYFLTSLVYVVLFYVVPGEVLLILAAPSLGFLPGPWRLLAANLAIYMLIYGALTLARRAFIELEPEEGTPLNQIPDWLRINGWRWLNRAGFVLVTAGALCLLALDRLPDRYLPLFIFLLVGLGQLWGRDPLRPLPAHQPLLRFDPAGAAPPSEPRPGGIDCQWTFCPSPSADPEEFKLQVAVSPEENARLDDQPLPASAEGADHRHSVRAGASAPLKRTAARLRELSREHGFSQVQEVRNVLALALSLRCEPMPTAPAMARPSFPLQTLLAGGGTWADLMILAATLLHLLGHEVGLLVPASGGPYCGLGYRPPAGGGLWTAKADDGRQFTVIAVDPSKPNPETDNWISQCWIVPVNS